MVISRIIFTLADNLALPLMLAEGYESCIKLRRTPFLFPLLKQGSISPSSCSGSRLARYPPQYRYHASLNSLRAWLRLPRRNAELSYSSEHSPYEP